MNTLVIYDSNFGNTKTIAETIGKELGAKVAKVTEIKAEDLKGYDLLIVGTPIIGWRPTVNLQAFLDKLPDLNGVKATTFDTRVKLFIHGDAMKKVANSLQKVGAKIVVKPMAFYVFGPQNSPMLLEGEIEKAKAWSNEIKNLI